MSSCKIPGAFFGSTVAVRMGVMMLVILGLVATTTAGQTPKQETSGSLGKVLMYPVTLGRNSHIVNFVRLAKILRSRGYDVHLLIGTDAGSWNELDQTFNAVHQFPSANESDIDYMKVALGWSSMSAYQFVTWLAGKLERQCEALLSHPDLLLDIQRERYDLLIADFIDNCGRIVSDYLDIPTITYSAPGFVGDAALFPDLPSFIPVSPMSTLQSGKMTFAERVENVIEYIATVVLWYPRWFGIFSIASGKISNEFVA